MTFGTNRLKSLNFDQSYPRNLITRPSVFPLFWAVQRFTSEFSDLQQIKKLNQFALLGSSSEILRDLSYRIISKRREFFNRSVLGQNEKTGKYLNPF